MWLDRSIYQLNAILPAFYNTAHNILYYNIIVTGMNINYIQIDTLNWINMCPTDFPMN